MRRPPRRILEQPDRANAAIRAQIEPVMRSARDADLGQLSGEVNRVQDYNLEPIEQGSAI
jgi:hypothetical protein